MTVYDVRAKRWAKGWELHISQDGEHVGVTQAKHLRKAQAMVRDYLETLYERDAGDDEIRIQPDLGEIGQSVVRVREVNLRVQRETVEAAAAARSVVRELRGSGMSVDDTAVVLGVSKGRVSQLARDKQSAV